MKKAIIENIYKALFLTQKFIKDIFITFFELTLCETLDIIKLIGFGLLVNGIYGFYKCINLGDFILIVGVLYGILKVNKKIKELEC
ncbi:hypothetical protein N5U23_04700 [Aliarcobacter butzleri]|uniref:hypothetical protein n=1 Tax=Aliarcobacter butzleri TaxID=28197 RepID=UPI0021B33922|nr:hypothetical protein [Aliarcobacter butzleri]MCT7563312.1 hypothetical protein [Aliarcobacter butzleri]MCT7648926.1 hypothetical protein [Aliarcobacter butzleri]